jgi:hypothetical protein
LEFDLEAQARDSRATVIKSVAEEIAVLVGENEDALTVRKMCYRDEWKKTRESLKAKFGVVVTGDFVKQAFEYAENVGLIVIREERTNGRRKQVPYQASEGGVEKDG